MSHKGQGSKQALKTKKAIKQVSELQIQVKHSQARCKVKVKPATKKCKFHASQLQASEQQ